MSRFLLIGVAQLPRDTGIELTTEANSYVRNPVYTID
jgi:hypothetical protein